MMRMNKRTPPTLIVPAPSEPTHAAAEAETLPVASDELAEAPARPRLDPTRYGDWELNGKCVDF